MDLSQVYLPGPSPTLPSEGPSIGPDVTNLRAIYGPTSPEADQKHEYLPGSTRSRIQVRGCRGAAAS